MTRMTATHGHIWNYSNNKSEREHARFMRSKGYLDIRNGWPDYCLYGKDGRVIFTEVKSAKDKLRPEQYAILTILHDLGLDVRISNGRNEGRELTMDELEIGHNLLFSWTRSRENAIKRRLWNAENRWLKQRIEEEAIKLNNRLHTRKVLEMFGNLKRGLL